MEQVLPTDKPHSMRIRGVTSVPKIVVKIDLHKTKIFEVVYRKLQVENRGKQYAERRVETASF